MLETKSTREVVHSKKILKMAGVRGDPSIMDKKIFFRG